MSALPLDPRLATKHLGGFKQFLLKQNALALAVGVVIGGAIGKVVSGIVDDVIMPIIAMLIPGGEWRTTKLGPFLVGDLGGRILDFVIVSFVIYVIVQALVKEPPPPAAPATKVCGECSEAILATAKRCKHCGQPA
jgi:large conductance mechanosensitive channel